MNMTVNSELTPKGRKVSLIFTESDFFEEGLHKLVYDHLTLCGYNATYNKVEDDGIYVKADSFKEAILIVKVVDKFTQEEMKRRLNDIYGFKDVSRETYKKYKKKERDTQNDKNEQ